MGGRPRGRAWEDCTAAKRAASRAAVGAGGGAGHRAVAIGKGDSGGGGAVPWTGEGRGPGLRRETRRPGTSGGRAWRWGKGRWARATNRAKEVKRERR